MLTGIRPILNWNFDYLRLGLRIVLVRVLQRNRTSMIYCLREIDCKVLTHMVVEAEKSCDLPSVNHRPKKPGGVRFKGLKERVNGASSSQRLKALNKGTEAEDRYPSQVVRGKEHVLLCTTFCSIYSGPQWTTWWLSILGRAIHFT